MPTEPASLAASRAPKRGKKYFTVAEANRALCYIDPVIDDLTDCYKRALAIRDRIEHPHPEDVPDQLKAEYEQAMEQLNDLVDELRLVGVELKDFEKGLLDFPAIYQGREIYLCWHRGEKQVTAWHEIDTGYAGRQDVALLKNE